jgi:HD-like signal output (HDOD) protein
MALRTPEGRTPDGHSPNGRDPMLAHDAEILEAASRLRPLSHSTAALVELTSRSGVDMHEIAQVVTNDQVLAATVLREANSAASGALQQIGSVDQALVRLGLARVLSVAVRSSVAKELHAALPQYGLVEGDLALDSVVGSVAAEIVRERSKVPLPPETATAALLRDIGLLVLSTFLDAPHLALLGLTREAGIPLPAGERMVLDANHAEVGAVLCQAWKFSEVVRLGVQYHHDPEECEEPIAQALYVSDAVARTIADRSGRTWSHAEHDDEVLAGAMAALGMDPADFADLVEATITRFGTRDTGLDLGLPD